MFFVFAFSCNEDNNLGNNLSSDLSGCMDMAACNYDSNATLDDGSCFFPLANHDCNGACVSSIDCSGICGGTSVNCPNWEDEPTMYLYTATFIGVIIINTEMNEGDMFAAFDAEGNVRGVGVQLLPTFGPFEGTIVYEMQLRSNEQGNLLTFKYYDSLNDVILNVEETYDFVINDLRGNLVEPLEFSVIN
ncbi:MAG: hypothetical protein VX820_00885 [Candidatus Neomarinimicrobiota bacterium]|nr:hypothetical protein [Candidatus Neomarinimicrobiota bacterium]